MIFGQYADNIINTIVDMRASDMKVLIWMAVRSQYEDGRIILNRHRVAKELKLGIDTVHHSLPVLEKWGFVEKVRISVHKRDRGGKPPGEYRVKIRYSIGKGLIEIPQMPLIQ